MAALVKFALVILDHKSTDTYREIKVGDTLKFLCNGFGRGGHYGVTVKVLKLNPKTIKAIEQDRSYTPGTPWRLDADTEVTIIEFSDDWKSKYADPEFADGDAVKIGPHHLYMANKKGVIRGARLDCGRYTVQVTKDRSATVGPAHLTKVQA